MAERIESRQVVEASEGSLRLQLYAVLSTAISLGAVKEHLAAHRAYLRQLEASNVLFAAGPLWTDDGTFFEGDGLLVYRAASVEEAHAIADADPLHSSGARTYRVRPWLLNDGSIGIRVTLSTPNREIV
jgi:uncharacterized protein